eukprot:1624355-Rhodomonas_salina.1
MDGREPLRVVVPEFRTKAISQSSPLAGNNNEITFHLQSSLELVSPDSRIIIQGLHGFSGREQVQLHAVTDGNQGEYLFCATNGTARLAEWTPTTNQLELTICGGKVTHSQVHYMFKVIFLNPGVSQRSPPISILATTPDFDIQEAAM